MQPTGTPLSTPFADSFSRGSDLLSPPSIADDQADFSRILSIASAEADSTDDADTKARDAAERLVAVVLVQPILKQMRESNQAAEPFKPTRGEQQFQSMLDAKFAQEITRSARFPLVERLARDMRQHVRTDAQPRFTASA